MSTGDPLLPEFAEDGEVEAKAAQGKDGRGELPKKAFFETYSAFANTNGGWVYLGVAERDGQFFAVGLGDVGKVQQELWKALNDTNRVSVNLLSAQDVEVVECEGRQVLRVHVPRASRQQRPVYVGLNPLMGTYRRGYEGDYRCREDAVRRMLAEQSEDSRDARLLPKYGLEDLDRGTLRVYRQRFVNLRPDHPWNELEDEEFLRSLGAFKRDRDSGEAGLTLAGLLMFGQLPSLLEAVPNYVVDYQEQVDADPNVRWTDRVTTDGTWSGNLFDFYRMVIGRLTQDLKVPFRLSADLERVDDTPAHQALREALVNTLIHADYAAEAAVRVVRRLDLFEFRNPGLMRVPVAEAIAGGHSDCRNRGLQKMFQLIGLGEQAGSGLVKVYRRWRQQDWRAPELSEHVSPYEYTCLQLRMVSLFPPAAVEEVQRRFGERFAALDELGRLVLVTIAAEGKVDHRRVCSMSGDHAADISRTLATLKHQGYLDAFGHGRGKYYGFAGDPDPGKWPKPEGRQLTFDEAPAATEAIDGEVSSTISGASTPISDGEWQELVTIAGDAQNKRRLKPEAMRQMILTLCSVRWLTLEELRRLLDRKPETLRSYLSQLVQEGKLRHLHAQAHHPQQAYRTTPVDAQEDAP